MAIWTNKVGPNHQATKWINRKIRTELRKDSERLNSGSKAEFESLRAELRGPRKFNGVGISAASVVILCSTKC